MTTDPTAETAAAPRGSRPRTRRLLLALLLAVLALGVLLPASPPALGWVWTQLQHAAEQQGFTLNARAVHGNLLSGLTLKDARLQHDSLDITLASLELDYSLASLLTGRLPLGVSLTGVRGGVNVQELLEQFEARPAAGSRGLPLKVSIGSLAVSDVQLAFSDAPEKYTLPDMSFNSFTASDTPEGFAFDTTFSTADGDAAVRGNYSLADAKLLLDVARADISIVRYWWEGIVAGNVTGSVVISAAGVEADALIHDASIRFLETTVHGISGSGTLRDLQILASVEGSGLGDTIRAEAHVDLAAEHFSAAATAEPQLASVVPWLGQVLDFDTSDIPAAGRLQAGATVSGWKEVRVDGSARGKGELAGRALAALDGSYRFTSQDGFALDLAALWSGGQVTLGLEPLTYAPSGSGAADLSSSRLNVTATDLLVSDGAGLLLDASAGLTFGVTAPAGQPNLIEARLTGPVADREVTLDAQLESRDLLAWQAQVSGADSAGSTLAGAFTLDAGLLTGRLALDRFVTSGGPDATALVSVDRAPLAASLPLTLEAAWGPLTLAPLPLRLDLAAPDSNLELLGAAGLLQLKLPKSGGVQLDLAAPPLLLGGEALAVTGSLDLAAAGQLSVDAVAQAFGLTARAGTSDTSAEQASTGAGRLITFELTGEPGDPEVTSGSFDPASGAWQASGSLPVSALARHWQLPLAGELTGSLSGSAASSGGAFAGRLESGDLEAAVNLTLAEGRLTAQAALTALGQEWLVDGELLPELTARARSDWGELHYQGGLLSGSGEISGPAGLPWQLHAQPADAQEGFALTLSVAGLELLAEIASDESGALGARASTDGLEAVWAAGLLDVTASNFNLAALLPGAAAAGELPVSGRIFGPPDELQVALEALHDAYRLQASGTLSGGSLLALELDASALAGFLTASGQLGGSLAQPRLDASLALQQIDSPQFSLPAFQADLLLGEDGSLTLADSSGTAGALQLEQGRLSGQLDLPLTLGGEAHRAALQLSGSSAEPGLTLALSGPLLAGRAWLDGAAPGSEASPELQFDLSADLARLAPALPLEVASLRGSVAPDGSWQAHAGTTLTALDALPLTLGAQAQGRLLEYGGSVNLRAASSERLLSASFSGAGSRLEVESDLQSLAATQLLAEAGLSGELQAAGQLLFSTDFASAAQAPAGGRGLAGLQADATLSGTVAGTQLDLRVRSDASTPLVISGLLGGAPLNLRAGTPLAGAGALLEGSWADALLSVTALPDGTGGAGTLLHGELTTLDAAANGNFTLSLLDGALELQELEASFGSFALQAAGPLLPHTSVTGALRHDAFEEPATLQVTSPDGKPQALISAGDLELKASLDRSLEVQLQGSLALQETRPETEAEPGFAALQLVSDLRWSPAAGFSGSASVNGPLAGSAPLGLQLQATGRGRLDLQGTLGTAHAPATRQGGLVDFTAQLPANPLLDQSLNGSVKVAVSLADLLPDFSGRPLVLSGSLAVGGNLARPALKGPLALTGLLEGAGSVELHGYAASGSARLAGEHFEVRAGLTDGAWDASLEVAEQPLAAFLPWLPEALLSSSAEAQGAIGRRTQAALRDFRITAPDSLLEASGTLGSDVQGVMNLDISLADVRAGVPLDGRLKGTLTYGSTGLQRLLSGVVRGSLQLEGVVLPGGGPVLSGSGQLRGSAQDPELNIDLLAGGTGHGQLTLVSRPAREIFELSSSVAGTSFSSDFRVAGDTAGLSASGTVTLPDGSFRFAQEAGPGIALAGEGAFEGWSVRFDPSRSRPRLQLSAYLQTLLPTVSGQLELDAGLDSGGVYLRGQLYDLRAAGFEVGDVTLRAANLLSGWLEVSGEHLSGRVNPAAGFSWELQRLELPVPGALSVLASGAGQGASAALDLVLTGSVAGETLNLPVRLTGTPAALNLTSSGSALGGQVTLDARLAGGSWQGELAAAQLQLGGVTFNARGPVTGERLTPQVRLQSSTSAGEVEASGELWFGLGDSGSFGLDFDQSVSGGQLQETLLLRGSVLPHVELELVDAAGGSFSVRPAETAAAGSFAERQLVAEGELQLPFDPALLRVTAQDGTAASVQLELPALPGFEVAGDINLASVAALMLQLDEGVVMQGRNATRGEARLDLLRGELELTDFGMQQDSFDVQLSGSINLRGQGSLDGRVKLGGSTALPGVTELPFSIRSVAQQLRLVSASQLGNITATAELPSGAFDLAASLASGNARAEVELRFVPQVGPHGRITLSGVELLRSADGPLAQLGGVIGFNEQRVSGDLRLSLGEGVVSAEGNWGLADLLPAWLAPRGATGGSGSARVQQLELAGIPLLQRRAPHLTGTVSGDVQASRNSVSGTLTADDLAAAGQPLPFRLALSGVPQAIELNGSLGDSPLALTLAQGELAGLLELRRFPLHLLAQAVAGPLDVSAEVSGVTRFTLPLAAPAQSELRLATELIRLERGGIITTGNLGLELSNGELSISNARFEGAGLWEAGGVLKSDELDFELTATDADFSPILGLIPPLALLDTSAAGSLRVTAQGTLQQPRISIASDSLAFELAGISYQLDDTELLLVDQDLTVDGHLRATDPVEASLQLGGGSKLALAPLQFTDAGFTFAGSAVVPVIGPLQQLEGSIRSASSEAGSPLLLDVTGSAGAPFQLAGSLLPLDLRVSGADLLLDMPALYLAETQVDIDLRLVHTDATRLSGNIFVDQARIVLQGEAGQAPPALSPERGALELGGNLLFSGITLSAPQRIRFNESFGTAELGGQLSLSGSLRDPLLSGYVQALRGTLQFSGRDFEVRNAVAEFDPNMGLYPLLDFTAVTSFEKNRVLPAGSSYEIVAPRDSNRIEVRLSFQGELEAAPESQTGFRLSVQPVLGSDARVQETRSDGLASGPRDLTENELLSLITLGRVEFGTVSNGAGGLASAVAEGALGTALDVFVLSELQRALGEALGLDVVEIRSSAVSSLFSGGSSDAFSVSLRLGGYLSEEVFASYRIGAFDDPRGLYALTNEVLLTYGLGPLELDLAGRVHFADTPGLDPGAELSVGLRYAFSELASLETGVDLSNERQQLRFGVTLHW